MEIDFDEDPYALPGDEDQIELFEQDGPGLFDEPETDVEDSLPEQTGPDLFGTEDPDDEASAASEPETDVAGVPQVAAPTETQGAAVSLEDKSAESGRLALYRRYRPDTFADVIGQDHVTVPLQRALENNRVNHAYLFSGPRGCGKTTSARILARCLNCEQGPTPTPCGQCQSCQDLARGGPGSIDVIEIDAASHGGVDDARDLRERAFFAPVHSRYKIYIVDEAHMVTTQGFNALLKLVEEPPPHAKFIFATTEPDKVIGTIRSRTHHYPFRLVPPRILTDFLTQICDAEGVAIDHTALPLVVRAGGGSVRDSLSVLDQLMGGAGEEGVGYAQAAALLGFTPDALLDEIMDAFAAGDAAGVYQCIDKVVEVGQDPRRFAEDLLTRLRDLIIYSSVPEAATNGMLEISDDQAQRLATQVAGMGAGELTRAAEVIATGLTQMRGTTAPRLHLELMCARVLLPGADVDERGLHARMDRLERRVGMMGDAQQAPQEWDDVPAPQPVASTPRPEAKPTAAQPQPQRPQTAERAADRPQPTSQPNAAPPAQTGTPRQRPAGAPAQGQPPAQQEEPAARTAQPGPPGQLTAAEMRRAWPSILEAVKAKRRFSHMLLSQHSQVIDVNDGALILGFANPGARENFLSSGTQDLLIDRIIEVIGVELRVEAVVSAAEQPTSSQPPQQRPQQRPAGEPASQPSAPPPPPQPPEPQQTNPGSEPEISAEDSALDDASSAALKLLVTELDATVIHEQEPDQEP